jgi:hypothetical protein
MLGNAAFTGEKKIVAGVDFAFFPRPECTICPATAEFITHRRHRL